MPIVPLPTTGVITFEEKKAAVKRIPASKPPEALDDESWAVQEFNEHKAMYEQLGHTLEDVKKQAPRLRSRQRPQLTGRGREQM